MASQWKDVSSFSKSDTDRTPTSWEIRLGSFRLRVHRYFGVPGWFATCTGVFAQYQLEAVHIDSAKREALAKFAILMEAAHKSAVDSFE